MADDTNRAGPRSAKKAYTEPKGRPTRARNDYGYRGRAFGPVAQWITVVLAAVVVIVIVIMVTGGGDFNPLNDDDPLGAPVAGSTSTVPTG